MRIHQFKKVTVSYVKVRVQYAEKTDTGYNFKEVTEIGSNAKAIAEKYNAGNKRVLEWEIVGTDKQSFKVNKNDLESWIVTHGVPVNTDDDADDDADEDADDDGENE